MLAGSTQRPPSSTRLKSCLLSTISIPSLSFTGAYLYFHPYFHMSPYFVHILYMCHQVRQIQKFTFFNLCSHTSYIQRLEARKPASRPRWSSQDHRLWLCKGLPENLPSFKSEKVSCKGLPEKPLFI